MLDLKNVFLLSLFFFGGGGGRERICMISELKRFNPLSNIPSIKLHFLEGEWHGPHTYLTQISYHNLEIRLIPMSK